MNVLLLGATAFLIWIWLFGSIVGNCFSRTFEQRSTEPVKEPRPRSMRVTSPIRRGAALQRATYPSRHQTPLQRAA